eukprot:TRINITY_DN5741_c0_g2_i6.p1 TRINITY_DN5741_c0_g2~~TRINITY_DN5741_c0_g2_i6.p1  ORF type:complete len:286 (+),score=44.74 TRINITY_DN5741_c0_g2_i6:318-1175(+)
MKEYQILREEAEAVARSKNVDSIVRFNIGGTVFCSNIETFMASGSLFAAILGSPSWKKNANGEYFIDRDPQLFPHIMTYLRSGKWYLNTLPVDQLDRLEGEIDFYGIRMIRDCFTLDENKNNSLTLTNNRTTASGSGTVLGVHPLPRFAVWEVVIESKTGNNWSGIGIATPRADLSSLCTDGFGCGIYIDQNNCYFRQRSENVEELNGTIGTAVAGKVIRITYRREEITTIQFETNGRQTQAYQVKLPERVAYVALSPSSDCTLSIRKITESTESPGSPVAADAN